MPWGAFGRRFEFSFSGIGFLEILPLRIAFSDMCFLERLTDGLNSQKCFAHFQKYSWWRVTVQWPVAEGGGPAAAGGGPTMDGGGLALEGGDLEVVRRQSNGERRGSGSRGWRPAGWAVVRQRWRVTSGGR